MRRTQLLVLLLLIPKPDARATLPSSATNIVSTVRCTLVDTRNAAGPFGGPRFTAGETRGYPVPAGPCPSIPAALGYGLTFTAIGPDANSVQLKAWATGAPMPTTPTLILTRGTGANPNNTTPRSAAIETGPAGSVNVEVDVGTDLLIEINSYYVGGLVFNINAGVGLLGGGTGNVTLGIAPGGVGTNELSAAGSHASEALMSDGSSVGWRLPPQGTITSVNAGPGLTGGGPSGAVTLNADFTPSGTLNGNGTTVARGDHKHYVQTVIVNPQSTPGASGTALIAALNGITDASVIKPYLLKIEPGIYDLGTVSLQMKQWVHIEGSGQRFTKITSATNNSSQGTVNATHNSELNDLTIASTNAANFSVALTLNNVSNFLGHDLMIQATGDTNASGVSFAGGGTNSFLRDVTIDVSGSAGFQIGVGVDSVSEPMIERATIKVSGLNAYGILSTGAPTLLNSRLDISAITAYGIWEVGSTAYISRCIIVVGANDQASGVFSQSILDLTDSEIVVTANNAQARAVDLFQSQARIFNCTLRSYSSSGNTTNTFAVYSNASAGSWISTVENSRLFAAWAPVYASAFAPVRIAASRMDGAFTLGTGASCAGVWDENFTFYPSTCP